MKLIAKLILIIIFIPIFLIYLLALNLRFQILASSFWENTFNSGNVYSKLSISINKNLESQAVAQGGKVSDVKILTDLITPDNLKDTIDKNIDNFLQYANGKVNEIIVYVPLDKVPKSLLSLNFGKVTEQMSLTELIKEFNISGITPAQIQMISYVGMGSWLFLFIVTLILAFLLYLLYLLTDFGRRLIAPGISLILAGITASFAALSGLIIETNWTKGLVGSPNLGDEMIGAVVPPVIQSVLMIWLLLASVIVILGVVLLFFKKPYNNKGNKKK